MKTCANVLVLLGAVCLDVNLQKAFFTMLFLLGVFFLLLIVSLATSTFVIAPGRRWSPLPFAPIRSNIVSDKMLAEHADPCVLEGLPQDLQKQSDPRSDGQLRSTAADIADTFQHLVSHVDTSPNETTGTDARVEAATKTESQTPRPSNIRGACLLWARLTSTRSACSSKRRPAHPKRRPSQRPPAGVPTTETALSDTSVGTQLAQPVNNHLNKAHGSVDK